MLKFDISSLHHFIDSEFRINTNICFVYGRNGTGKTSLADFIKNDSLNKDCSCYVFSGFEGILSENRKLEALVLGDKNVEIDNKITSLEKKRESLINKRDVLIKKITPPIDGEKNLFLNKQLAENEYNNIQEKIKKIESKYAAEIKNYSPQIAPPSYNIKNFRDESKLAASLSDFRIRELTDLLHSEIKEAKKIPFLLVDFHQIFNEVNSLLLKFVVEKKVIDRFKNSPERIQFAKIGLALHKANEICSFCGNRISYDCIQELQGYFSAKDVSIFQNEIGTLEKKLLDYLSKLDLLSVDVSNFYPELKKSAIIISNELDNQKKIVSDFLNRLITAISNKKSELFTSSPILDIDVPSDFHEISQNYELLRQQNNSNNIYVMKNEARKLLRYHEIQRALNDPSLMQLKIDLKNQEIQKIVAQNLFDAEKEKISGHNGFEEQLSDIDKQIESLKKQTLNEKILADKINNKLKSYVSFELVHSKGEFGPGYYLVHDLVTGEKRNVSEVSTGERNIIAFLYFLGKIKVGFEKSRLPKIIIFDDPMNSNDELMQYIIISELQKLIKTLDNDEYVLIFTHNKHFYLNVSHGYKYFNEINNKKSGQQKREDEASFIHFLSDSKKTTICYISNREDDFRTNYDSLWHELKFLYNCNSASADLLLNPIRRIVETFVKFNSSSYNKFFNENNDAKKLFDVNSHSVDDLESELNGLTKNEIIDLVKKCFKNNNAQEHFDKHWN